MAEPNPYAQYAQPQEEEPQEEPGLLTRAGQALGLVDEPEPVPEPVSDNPYAQYAPTAEGIQAWQQDQQAQVPTAQQAYAEDAEASAGIPQVNPYAPQPEAPPAEEAPGELGSFFNYILRGTGGIGTGLLQAGGLATARSPEVLGVMDEYEAAQTDESREEIKSKADRLFRPRAMPPMAGGMQGDVADWDTWQQYLEAEEDPVAQAKIRIGMMRELAEAMDSPMYEAGESFDAWVAEQAPVIQHEEGSWAKFFKDDLPQGIGSMVGFIGSALLTRGAASKVMGRSMASSKAGSFALGLGGAAVPGAAVNYSGVFNDAIAEGADVATAFRAAEKGGYIGVLEGVPIATFLSRADKASGGQVTKYFKNVLTQGGEEAVQEGLNDLLNNWVAQGYYDPDRQIWGDETARAAGLGMTTGGLLEALMGLLPGRQRAMAERGGAGDPADDPSRIIEARMQAAEQAALDAGADPLAAKNAATQAGEEAAAEVEEQQAAAEADAGEEAAQVESDQVAVQEAIQETQLAAELAAQREARQKGVREEIDKAPTPEQAEELEGEQAVEEADRLSAQEQAAERYEKGARRVREEPAFEEAERQEAAKREEDFTEMEVQRPPPDEPPGGTPPASPAMGEAMQKARRTRAERLAKEAEPKPVGPERQIEDRTADFDVTPEGEAQPRGQQPRVQPPAQEPGIERPFVTDEDEDVSYRIDEEADEAATSPTNDIPEPSQAQIDAGNYKKGHVSVQGLDITIENPKGSTRSSAPDARKEWSQVMQSHYGYLRRSEGADGDQIDVFIGENPTNDSVFVVDQVNQESGNFDEHKAMIGFNNMADAKRGYLRNYEKGWKAGPITEMTMEQFKLWVERNPPTRPAAGIDLGSVYSPELAESMSSVLGEAPGPPIPPPSTASLERAKLRRITPWDRATDYLVYDRTRTDEEIAASLDEIDAYWADRPSPYEDMNSEDLVKEMDRLITQLGKTESALLSPREVEEIQRGLAGRGPQEGDLKYRLDEESSQGALPGIPPVAPDFYSRMRKTVEQKMPNRMPERQLWEWQNARVKAGDFNEAEAAFIDLAGEFVTAEGDSVIPKSEVLDWLEIRQPDILEKVLVEEGAQPVVFAEALEAQEYIRNKWGPTASWSDLVFQDEPDGSYVFVQGAGPVARIRQSGGARRPREDITAGTRADPFTWTITEELQEHDFTQHDNNQLFDADENYREILYVLPYSGSFQSKYSPPSAHWPETEHSNTVAHVRVSDVTNMLGEPVLFVQELQSDWHQQARDIRKSEIERLVRSGKSKNEAEAIVPKEYGYIKSDARKVYEQKVALNEAGFPDFDDWLTQVLGRRALGAVEDAPFKRDWPLMVMKRLITRAIREGKSEVAWANGTDIAKQWNLARTLGMVEFEPVSNEIRVYDTNGSSVGTWDLDVAAELAEAKQIMSSEWTIFEERMEEETDLQNQYSVSEEADDEGNFMVLDPHGDPIHDYYGDLVTVTDSNMLRPAVQSSGQYIDGVPGWRSVTTDLAIENISVGGSGMEVFYNKELVNKVNKYVKKLGSQVSEQSMVVGNQSQNMWSFPITPKMRQTLLERGQPMFRRGEQDVAPQPTRKTAEEAHTVLDPIIKQLGGLKVRIVNDATELPPNLFNKLQADNAMGAKGFFHHTGNTVYVLAGNHQTNEDLERTLLHEGVAHAGLRALLPQQELDAVLDQVWGSADLSKLHARYRHDQWKDQTKAQRATAEEHIAHLAEVDPDNSLVKRVVAMVRNALRQMGVGLKWTDDDIYSLLRDTRRALKRVELDTIDVTTPAQVSGTGEIIDLTESAEVALRQHDKRAGVVQSLQECLAG